MKQSNKNRQVIVCKPKKLTPEEQKRHDDLMEKCRESAEKWNKEMDTIWIFPTYGKPTNN